jgi:hypothetical protein
MDFARRSRMKRNQAKSNSSRVKREELDAI